VTKIVVGRSAVSGRHFLKRATLTEQLIAYAPDLDIHIIPDKSVQRPYHPKKLRNYEFRGILKNGILSFAILSGCTCLGIFLDWLEFTNVNIIMVYILGVLLTSIATAGRIYSLVSSIASVFVFNFLFTHPRFSFLARETGYPLTFVVMFLTAYISGTLAIRYKEQAHQAAKIAYRTKILFDTDQMLSKANGKEEILKAAGEQMLKLLKRTILIFENKNGVPVNPRFFLNEKKTKQFYDREKELSTVKWVLENNHTAGATTDTFSDAEYLYFALRVNERVYGVVGIEIEKVPLDASEHGILLSILGECALALENEKNAREKEEAAIRAEREQLRANLLRTISHDLRTPLTTISGNASNLISNGEHFDKKTKLRIYEDIYEDSIWLINLVENLLYATRIEDGRMILHTSTELLSEIIEEAIHHVNRKAAGYRISVFLEDEFWLVKADARLVVQVMINIIDNAIKYAGDGSVICISSHKKGDKVEIRIADNGEGIAAEEKEKIFEKFYRGRNKIADNRRSLGLGLYLCKAIVEAHGGMISVSDNLPKGTVFSFTLPLEEIAYHE